MKRVVEFILTFQKLQFCSQCHYLLKISNSKEHNSEASGDRDRMVWSINAYDAVLEYMLNASRCNIPYLSDNPRQKAEEMISSLKAQKSDLFVHLKIDDCTKKLNLISIYTLADYNMQQYSLRAYSKMIRVYARRL